MSLLITLLLLINQCYSFAPRMTISRSGLHSNHTQLNKRATISTELSTCGYLNGDSKKSRTADSGYNCRVDTQYGLWGFCPTTVLTASDCGLAGACVDEGTCSGGCGLTESTKLTTFTCKSKSFCSTALLTFGVDQTYSYIACGNKATTDHYMISPTADTTTTSSTTVSSSKPTSDATVLSESSLQSSSETSTVTSTTLTEASTATQEASSESTDGRNNTGPIVGGVVGGLALICGTIVAAIYLLRKNRREKSSNSSQPSTQGGELLEDFNKGSWQNSGWGPQELPANRPPTVRIQPAELAG